MIESAIDYRGIELDDEQVRNRIEALRNLINNDGDICAFRTDDNYLLRFLYATAFHVDEAYKRVKTFYELIVAYPEWFASVSPAERRELLTHNIKTVLPGRDREGRRIYVTKFENVDTKKVTFKDLVHLDDYWFELTLEEPETYSKGICCILDAKGYSWKIFQWLTPTTIRFGTKKADSFPCKEIVFHVVNTSTWVNASVKLAWPFLSAQLKERIKFHFSDLNSLHDYVSPEVLPPEYGGTASVNFEKQVEWLLSNSSDVHQRLIRNAIAKNPNM